MKKIVIILGYLIVFWVLLPGLLLYAALILDKKFAFSWTPSLFTTLAGIMISAFSISLLFLSIIQFKMYGRELPVSATPAPHLIRKGLYAVWRHPIYLFFTLTFTGIALMLPSFSLLLVVLPLFISAELAYIYIEERYLIRRFGEAYRYYKKQTPLVFPAFYNILKLTVYGLFRIFFSYRVTGKENIPANPPFFVLAAHKNYLDPLFIAAAIGFPVRFITTKEVFRNPLSRIFFQKLNCLPKKRYTADHAAVRSILHAIEHQQVIGIFPEGERSWTGKTAPFKPEVLNLLQKYRRVPILPVRISGNYSAWPRWAPWPRRTPVKVHFQNPVFLESDRTTEQAEEQLRKLTDDTDSSPRCRSKRRTKDIFLVLYRCPVCRSFDPFILQHDAGFNCRQCGTGFMLDDANSIHFVHEGRSIETDIEQFYRQIRIVAERDLERDVAGSLKPIRSTEATLYREQKNRLVKKGEGRLTLENNRIKFEDHVQKIGLYLDRINSVTIEGNNRLQIFDRQEAQLLQFIFKTESALKWQDYILEVMKKELGRTPNCR